MGAGGQSRSIIPLLIKNNFRITGILDDTFDSLKNEVIYKVKVIGTLNDYKKDVPVVLAFGDNIKRKELYQLYDSFVLKQNIIHSTAFIDGSARLGNSNHIFGQVFINSVAVIGDNNIINTGCIIEHEVNIGNHNHISVGSILCGRVHIGDNCFIGAGAVVIDKLSVCSDVVIGANSVVIDDITEPGTYVGNPVRKIK